MKTSCLVIPAFALTFLMSSCFYEVAEPPHVEVYATGEYETEELIRSYGDRFGTYHEYRYRAWIDVELRNTGGLAARNVEVEILIADGYREFSTVIQVSDLYPGEHTTLNFDTGYSRLDEYDGYEVYVYWD